MNRGTDPRIYLAIGLLFVLLTACIGMRPSEPDIASCALLAAGDVTAGEIVFRNTLEASGGGARACVACHVVDAGEPQIVGPPLVGIARVAGTRVEGMSAEEYLCQSVVNPGDYLVTGYADGLMPVTYELYLSQEQLNDLVAYMQTLE